ncbi:unnamed protein product [Lasius platythorax]|uniref:Uncharacterized protein n=1 Tax=Lasius platythorax TaxID=488582 RepID=A0AAV2N121_9HYME
MHRGRETIQSLSHGELAWQYKFTAFSLWIADYSPVLTILKSCSGPAGPETTLLTSSAKDFVVKATAETLTSDDEAFPQSRQNTIL